MKLCYFGGIFGIYPSNGNSIASIAAVFVASICLFPSEHAADKGRETRNLQVRWEKVLFFFGDIFGAIVEQMQGHDTSNL